MALREAATSSTSFDAVDGVMLKAGEVVYKGVDHELSLLEKGLRLVSCKSSEPGKKLPVLDLSWRDVVCASKAPVKKSKSTQPSSVQDNTFFVHFILKDMKTKKCHCQDVQLVTKEEDCETWVLQIEKMRKEGKPQKLFVIINPIGGKGRAQKQFDKISRPLFDLAGIELIVKVTERAQHARVIAKDIFPSKVDGVIIVGGDGLYMEVLHTLVLATQEEAVVDVNDPEAKLVSPALSFGIIPGGTGNGVSGWLNGVKDFKTATLNIIRGETNGTGIFSLHEPGKLIHYCGILFGYGLYPDMMETINGLRWLKQLRIAYASMTKMFGKKRVYDIDVEVLGEIPKEKLIEERMMDMEATSSTSGWSKLGIRRITAMLALLADVNMETEGNTLQLNPFCDTFHLSLVSTHSGLDYIKMLHEYSQMKKDTYRHDYVEMINKIRGLRFRLLEDEKKEERAVRSGGGDVERPDIGRLLDVDGEVMTCTVPDIQVRLHPYLIQAYSVKETDE